MSRTRRGSLLSRQNKDVLRQLHQTLWTNPGSASSRCGLSQSLGLDLLRLPENTAGGASLVLPDSVRSRNKPLGQSTQHHS